MSQRFGLLPGGVPMVTVDATDGDETVLLPGGYAAGRGFKVRRRDNADHLVLVTVVSGGSIDGDTDGNRSIVADSEVSFESDGYDHWDSYGVTGSEGAQPSGPAGGVLTGTYPAPSALAANSVTTAALQAGAVTAAKAASDLARTVDLTSLSDSTDAAVAAVQDAADAAQEVADAAIPMALLGVADGVAELNDAGAIPIHRIAGASPDDFGAAKVVHSHGVGDIPDVLQKLGAASIVVGYDADAEQWLSTRAALAPQPGQLVIWYGDAQAPADADDNDLHIFLDSAIPLPPVDPPDDPSDTRDANGVVLNIPTVTVTDQTANVTALLNTDDELVFTYLQFALRRTSDSANGDCGHTNNVTIDGDYTLTGSRSGLGAGNWTAAVAYSLDGTTWVNGPSDDFTIAAPTSSPSTMTVGARSGLTRNSGIFYQAGSRTAADSFATWRNRPLDAIMYFTGRNTWQDLLWLRDDLTSWPGYRIVCVPFQPQLRNQSTGAVNPEGSTNLTTAAGTNNARWVNWGQVAKDKGWDDGRTIVRLSWENNGNWYDWAWGNTTHYTSAGSAISNFTTAWTNVVTSIRSTAPKTLFNCNVNRGNTRSGVNFFTDILDAIADYVDIVGLDWYNHAPAQLSQGEFDSTAAQTYSGDDIHAWCVTNDKFMSLDEWGVSHGKSGAGGYPGGGDDPNWINRMWTWMQAHSVGNGGRLILDTTYNDPGAPSELAHSLFNPSQNPNAAAVYKQSNRWGG